MNARLINRNLGTLTINVNNYSTHNLTPAIQNCIDNVKGSYEVIKQNNSWFSLDSVEEIVKQLNKLDALQLFKNEYTDHGWTSKLEITWVKHNGFTEFKVNVIAVNKTESDKNGNGGYPALAPLTFRVKSSRKITMDDFDNQFYSTRPVSITLIDEANLIYDVKFDETANGYHFAADESRYEPWLVEVVDADLGSMTSLSGSFIGCTLLKKVKVFDTSAVTDMGSAFWNCSELEEVPLFNTSSCENMTGTFRGCISVKSGALALYQQASSQTTVPSDFSDCFDDCGSRTDSGLSELNQIPTSWGGNYVALLRVRFKANRAVTEDDIDFSKGSSSGISEYEKAHPSGPWPSPYPTPEPYPTTTLTTIDEENHIYEVTTDNANALLFARQFLEEIIDSNADVCVNENVISCFEYASNLKSGMLDFYNKAKDNTSIIAHIDCFSRAGEDDTTGTASAELAQIPTSWGGKKS